MCFDLWSFDRSAKGESELRDAMRLRPLRVLLCTAIVLGACSGPQESTTIPINLSRRLPVWAPLTPYEESIIEQALTSQDDSLWLQVAFVVSGRIRTHEFATPLVARYEGFLEQVESRVVAAETSYQKGDLLLMLVHDYLLANGTDDPSFEGYTHHQFFPDVLLETSEFNCTSSAIVYGLAAQHFGFEVNGVSLPHHIFVQLTVDGEAQILEVETTNRHGFGQNHDQDYYERLDTTLTIADYEQREILPFADVILRLSVATEEDDVALDINRLRLMEIAGFLTRNPALQGNRLAAWTQYCTNDMEVGRYDAVAAMLSLVEGEVALLHQNLPTTDVRTELGWFYVCGSQAMTELRRFPEARNLSYLSLETINEGHQDRARAVNNFIATHYAIAEHAIDQGDFELAASLVVDVENLIGVTNESQRFRMYTFGNTSARYLDDRNWSEAVSASQQCMDIADENGDKPCVVNMEIAFVNMAVDMVNSGDEHGAQQVLRRCLQVIDYAPECETRLAGQW